MYLFLGGIMKIVDVPLGWILYAIHWLLGNYGLSILVFALFAKLIMLPSSIKTHRNQVRMREIQPKIKKIQEKYHNDNRNPKLQQELQDLYTREGYSPMAGCLPTLLQFPLIFGLWDVVRQPLTYILDVPDTLYATTEKLISAGNAAVLKGEEMASSIHTLIDKIGHFSHVTEPEMSQFKTIEEYNVALSKYEAHMNEVHNYVLPTKGEIQSTLEMNEIYIADAVNDGGVEGALDTLQGRRPMIDTEFAGLNLGETAGDHGFLSWFILIPIVAALSSFLVSFVSMKINQAHLEGGAGKSMNAMMFIMPLLSLWIGYNMTIGVALYWVSTNILSLIQTIVLPKILERKPATEPIVKEKKLNYTQIEKMKRDGEQAMLNGEKLENDKE